MEGGSPAEARPIDSAESSCFRANRVAEGESSCMFVMVPLFRGSSRFASLILSHHSRVTCECNKGEINDARSRQVDPKWRESLRLKPDVFEYYKAVKAHTRQSRHR